MIGNREGTFPGMSEAKRIDIEVVSPEGVRRAAVPRYEGTRLEVRL